MWMIRAGSGGERVNDFLQHGVVAFGGVTLGALVANITKEQLLALYAERYPEQKEGSRASWASQLLRLHAEIKVGDDVVTYDRDRRRYILGRILSEYEWAPSVIQDLPHIRRVQWMLEVPRDLLSVATRNTLGAIQALFRLNADAAKDLRTHAVVVGASTEPPTAPPTEKTKTAPIAGQPAMQSVDDIVNENLDKAEAFIEDSINALDWQEMQLLVAGILRAMGYKTTVSEPGPDRGVDIFASPDGLGLQEPRIFVEVKHRVAVMGAKEIRAFLGGRQKDDRCLFVSTGGFTKDAHYEAERAEVPTRLIDLRLLRKLYVDHYDRLDTETQSLVPLRRLYWPIDRER